MAASNYLENKIRDHIHGVAAYTAPANVYFGLHTANPGEDGATGEVAAASYTRAAYVNSTAGWNTSALGASTNKISVRFPDALESWGTVSHYSKWDAFTGGNCLEYGSLAAGGTLVSSGDVPRFSIGDISESVE